jgi:hypothetical protein
VASTAGKERLDLCWHWVAAIAEDIDSLGKGALTTGASIALATFPEQLW